MSLSGRRTGIGWPPQPGNRCSAPGVESTTTGFPGNSRFRRVSKADARQQTTDDTRARRPASRLCRHAPALPMADAGELFLPAAGPAEFDPDDPWRGRSPPDDCTVHTHHRRTRSAEGRDAIRRQLPCGHLRRDPVLTIRDERRRSSRVHPKRDRRTSGFEQCQRLPMAMNSRTCGHSVIAVSRGMSGFVPGLIDQTADGCECWLCCGTNLRLLIRRTALTRTSPTEAIT